MSKFTHDDAMRLIKKMRMNYGKKFADQWSGVEPSELADEMVDQYQGLTSQDFGRGIERMKREEWPPTIPAFRSWCEPKSNGWLGANEAWNIARSSIDFNGNELTVVWTRECAIAFDAVADMVKLGDKYQIAEARKVFVERYERMVTESLERGEKPCYEISYGDDKEQRQIALKQAEIAGYLPSGSTQLMIEQTQTPEQAKNESQHFKTIAQEHLEKLGKLIKRNPEKVAEDKPDIELFNTTGNLPEWADPFDEREKFVKGLIADKKPIPLAIK